MVKHDEEYIKQQGNEKTDKKSKISKPEEEFLEYDFGVSEERERMEKEEEEMEMIMAMSLKEEE